MRAADLAHVTEFALQCPHGFQTMLGGNQGIQISSGQKQRIAIARAILKNPPILLLDEATNALDAENEYFIQKSLKDLMRNRTTLVIAHRLSTVLHAQRIVVLDQGRIQDVGNHAELISSSPLYQRLATFQLINPKQPLV
jgi:ATP-binding cassette subfamily B protein